VYFLPENSVRNGIQNPVDMEQQEISISNHK
jgi:hypothetical protein